MPVSQDLITAAQAAARKRGVPASVTLAQYAIESGYGAHAPGHNPFGMKPRAGMHDPQQMLATTEVLHGKVCHVQQPFRVFPSIAAAFDAHAELLATAPVYAPARAKLPVVPAYIDAMAAHYATDPQYAAKLKAVIAKEGWAKLDAHEAAA